MNMSDTNDVKLPPHGGCFICDPTLPSGIGIQWYGRPDGVSIHSVVTLDMTHQGPPNHAHGGASAAILDDAMGTCAWYAGHMVMTAKMTVNYRRPVPLGVELTAQACVTGTEGRKVFVRAELCLPNGDVAVETDGLFVVIREMFENSASFEERIALAKQKGEGI